MGKPFAFAVYDRNSDEWNTEGTLGANDGVLYVSLAPHLGVPTPQVTNEIGVDEEKEPTSGLIEGGEMSVTSILRHENFDQLFAALMGADAVTQPQSGVYQHLHTYVNQPSWRGYAGWDGQQDGLFSWPGMYVTGMEITGDINGETQVVFSFIVAKPTRESAVNDQTVMDAVGYHTQQNRVVLTDEDSYFRLNLQSGGSLAAADEACISSFRLSMQRSVEPIYCLGTGPETQEPVEKGFPDVSLSVTFSKRVDAALPETYGLLTPAQDGTPLKAELMLRGGTISAAYDHHIRFRFPALTITPDISLDIDDPNINELEVPFKVTGAETAPTDMPVTTYLDIETQNTVSGDYIS